MPADPSNGSSNPRPTPSRKRRSNAIYRVGRQPRASGKWVERISAYLGFAKDVLDIFWKVAPFTLVLPGAMLLLFLKRCNWSELFVESAISVPGLTYVLITGLLAAALLMLTFVLPSVMTIGINFGNVRQEFLSKTVIPIYLAALVGWISALVGTVFLNLTAEAIVFFAPAFALAMSVYLMAKGHAVPYPDITGRWEFLLRSGEATFAVMMNAFGILVLMKLIPPSEGGDHIQDAVYVGCWAVISVVGIGPGMLYLRLRARRHGYVAPLKVALTGAVFAGLIALYGIGSLVPVSLRLLEVAGIFSDEIADFQIMDKNVASALKRSGLKISIGPDGEMVSGYARYNLNGVRLICKRPLESKRAGKWWVGPSDTEWRAARTLAGSNCVKTITSELRRLTPTGEGSVPTQ